MFTFNIIFEYELFQKSENPYCRTKFDITIYATALCYYAGHYVFAGIFTFFVCLRFKFKIFNHERSEGLKILNLNRKQTHNKITKKT